MKRTAVVTGTSRGIGRKIVERLARDGYRIFGVSRTVSGELAAQVGGELCEVEGDVTDPARLREIAAEVGPVHALVVNAGLCERGWVGEEGSLEVWRRVMRVNLDGAWNTLDAFAGRLEEGGSVVTVSSGLGKNSRPGYGAYTASKHGLLGLTKCFAKEVAPRGITVNAVCPGWVDTEMAGADLQRTSAEQQVSVDEARRAAEAGIPLGRFVDPDEVAALVAWLLSPDARAITGQAYNISCGELPG